MLITAEKKIIEGKTCIAKTKPTEGVPSSREWPGPIAKGPKRKIDPFWEACNNDMNALLIHSRKVRGDPEGQYANSPSYKNASSNGFSIDSIFATCCPCNKGY